MSSLNFDKNFDCIGIEPSKSCAEYARAKNISVILEFFDLDLAKDLAKKKTKKVTRKILYKIKHLN